MEQKKCLDAKLPAHLYDVHCILFGEMRLCKCVFLYRGMPWNVNSVVLQFEVKWTNETECCPRIIC